MRSKAKRLVGRGWLVEQTPSAFSPPGQAAAHDHGHRPQHHHLGRIGPTLVVPSQAARAHQPRERPLHQPRLSRQSTPRRMIRLRRRRLSPGMLPPSLAGAPAPRIFGLDVAPRTPMKSPPKVRSARPGGPWMPHWTGPRGRIAQQRTCLESSHDGASGLQNFRAGSVDPSQCLKASFVFSLA